MRKLLWILVILAIVVIGGLLILNQFEEKKPQPGTVKDEALAAGRTAESMPGADEDYFADMDYGATKRPAEIQTELAKYIPGITPDAAVKAAVIGRNNWIVWTGGNDRLWDMLSINSVGALDLLKTISNYDDPTLPANARYTRRNRWAYLGLVNEPCYAYNDQPRADRFGLRLDVRTNSPDCPPDPFENEQKYPGVKIGARGTTVPVGSYYGYGTGIVGLRLFPNPAFDEAAKKNWDPKRYYDDPSYYNSDKLIKPYRVGMSCGFCHVGPNPSNPPADPENPKWENLNSNPGAQYFWIDRIFMFHEDRGNFIWQLFHTSRPGALDTSLVSSDQINNPRTMNAIYSLGARLDMGRRWGAEQLAGGGLNNKQFNDYVPNPVPPASKLTGYYDTVNKITHTTHVLKDGSDSVGALGALNRVYLNIGLFSEEWTLHFVPLIGGRKITPIPIATAEKNSTYWNANTNQTPAVALFFLATAKPDYLTRAPGGADYLAKDAAMVPRGKEVFAERCARCHSSKLPDNVYANFFQQGCIGPNYLKCWSDYWNYTKTPEFRTAMKTIVNDPNFLTDNFLSSEVRVPVTLLETNACSPIATNALRNNIWDNFSSESYKNLPSVGRVQVHHPYTGAVSEIDLPGGGRGFTRPASLISLWSTAPYLQNNSVGHFEWSGSVPDRVAAFEDGITQMLWPEKRTPSTGNYMTRSGKLAPGLIDLTTERSYLKVAPGFLPKDLEALSGPLDRWFPNFFGSGGVRIGPIPKGTPVNMLSNVNLEAPQSKLLWLLLETKHRLKKLPAGASDEEAKKALAPLVPTFLEVCKCRDFVVNRGHYFGTDYLPASEGEPGLSDDDKHALIAFLKTF